MQKDPAWHVPDEAWAGALAGRVIPPGDPQNPLKARWMGFHDGAGIHGTADIGSLGAAASHGCIRMAVPDVVKLYRRGGGGAGRVFARRGRPPPPPRAAPPRARAPHA